MFCHERDFKYRICPPQPLAYGDWRERYQGARVANPGITRAGLTDIASESRRRGKPIEAPSGSNCLDLEVYTVNPDHHLTIRGTKKIKVPCAEVLPLVEGIFGPLRIPLPRSPCMLLPPVPGMLKGRSVRLAYGSWLRKMACRSVSVASRSLPVPCRCCRPG